MAWDINQVTLIGRLTKDPELRYGQSGTAFCLLSIVVNKKSMKEGMQDEVYFIGVTTFGKTAEICSQYLAKGKQIAVQGYLQQKRWEDQNGQNRSQITVVAERVQFLSPQNGADKSSEKTDYNTEKQQADEYDDRDEIPF